MNVDFELYRIFYVVANAGNITKAANELHISQPAVTQSIRKLEGQLGGNLFTRTKRGVNLTEEGKEFFNYIKQAIDFINNAEHKFSQLINLETGCIRIGVSTTLTKEFLISYLQTFHKQCPKIEIQIITDVTVELIPMLRKGMIDLIVSNLPLPIKDKDIKIIPCKDVHDCFICNKDYIELTKKPMPLNEIVNYPLILQRKPANTRAFLDNFMQQSNIVLKPIMDLASYTLVVEFTRIGLGIGYATKEYIKKYFDDKELYEIKTIPAVPKRQLGLVVMEHTLPSFSAKKLIDIILDDCQKK